VDIGFSSTTVVPVIAGQAMLQQMRRLDVGGKLLTNYLKELVSHRHWNMMDETYVVNQAKHQLCYVSLDYEAELRAEALSFRGPEARRRARLRARMRARARASAERGDGGESGTTYLARLIGLVHLWCCDAI
jgi:actin-related protein